MSRTVILHVDMDAFYAAVEQRDDPTLVGKPVIVGGPDRRGVVTTASYEARPFGVHSAMPMSRAMRLCPHAIVVPPRLSYYLEISGQLMDVLDTFSPVVEPLSLEDSDEVMARFRSRVCALRFQTGIAGWSESVSAMRSGTSAASTSSMITMTLSCAASIPSTKPRMPTDADVFERRLQRQRPMNPSRVA